ESGSPCRGSYHCDEPFRCSNDYMGICEMPAARGEPCGPYGLCSDGTYCDGTICVPAKEDGATCTDHVECQGQCLSGVCPAICGGTYFVAGIDSAPAPSCSDLHLERARTLDAARACDPDGTHGCSVDVRVLDECGCEHAANTLLEQEIFNA